MIRRSEVKFVVFLCLLPFLLIAAAEGAGHAWMWWKYGVPGKSYGIYKPDPELGGILAENSYNTMREFNNLAFQRADDTQLERPAGRLRILTYGGSTTFSYNVLMAQTWPALLEKNLRAAGFENAEVLNAGDVVWSLGHAIVRARRELGSLKPDYVILYSGVNEWSNHDRLTKLSGIDLAAELRQGRHGLIDNHLMKANFLFRDSLLYKLFHHRVATPLLRRALADAPDAPDVHAAPFDPAIQENYERVLRDFAALVEGVGAQVVFVVQAMATDARTAEEAAQARQASAALRVSYEAQGLALELGATVLDAQTPMLRSGRPGDALFGPGSDVHFSVEGSRLLADYLAVNGPWKTGGGK